MARVVKPRKQRIAPSTPLQAMLEEYIESLAVKGFTDDTRHVRREHLSLFERWAMERGLTEPVEVTRPVLERYQRYLFHYRKKDGQPLSFASQHSRLSPLRMWFRWMTRQNYLLHNPASEIELPRLPKPLPRVLTASEAELILHQPNVADPVGIRDRAMLETFYSTGMRRTELVNLKLYDVDRAAGVVTIREGKGKKDRVIPIGERAVAWLDKYLDQARQAWRLPSLPPHDGHADAGGRRGHPLHTTNARSCAARHNADLHARLDTDAQTNPLGNSSSGATQAQLGSTGGRRRKRHACSECSRPDVARSSGLNCRATVRRS
jgi:site-specific recombinase XerD